MANNRPKSKRSERSKSISSVQPRSYSDYLKKSEGGAAEVLTTQATSEARASRSATPVGRGSETVDWQGEYGYVLRDLRTLLIVSVILFAAMIGTGLLL